MTHPNREEWMAYLYQEVDSQTQADLTAHLHVCPECKAALDGWRGTMSALQTWKLPAPAARSLTQRPAIKWGIAAAIMLGLGFGFGQLASPKLPDSAQLRAALLPVLRQELRQELNADVLSAFSESRESLTNEFRQQLRGRLDQWAVDTAAAANLEARRLMAQLAQNHETEQETDRQATLAVFKTLDQQQRADYGSLLHKLETVAVVAQGGFQETQNQIDQLALYSQNKFSTSK